MSLDDAAARIGASALRQGVPGLAACVVWPNGSTWQRGFGVADLASATPAGPDTPFLWFSMTKIATATAVMRLSAAGALDLDAPVTGYLPEFSIVDQPRPVTVRNLLSHSSGLANPFPVRWVRPATAPAVDQRAFVMRLLRSHRRLRFEPGTRSGYTNLGYLVLGEVVASVTAMPFTEHLRRDVLAPLGMSHTGFSYADCGTEPPAVGYQPLPRMLTPLLRAVLPAGIVAGHRAGLVAYHLFTVLGAAYGGLIGSAADAVKLLRLHLRDGDPLLPAQAAAAMRTIIPRDGRLEFGLGWYRPAGQRDFVEHLGGGSGFWNVMRLYPDLGVVLMGNTTRYDHDRLLTDLVAAARG
jgi:CubicO group peptidase (beta-lactamase class C family)